MKMRLFIVIPFILVFVVGVLSLTDAVVQQGIVPGGVSTYDRPATDEVRELIRNIHPQIRAHLLGAPGGRNIRGEIYPISFRTQLVNGVNYFVKVKAHTLRKIVYYHLRIYKSFTGNIQLIKVNGPKTADDAINFF